MTAGAKGQYPPAFPWAVSRESSPGAVSPSMSKRNNLLDAFRSVSDDESSSPDPPKSVSPPTPTPVTQLPSSGRTESSRPASATAASLRTPFPAWLGWVAGVVAAFAVGVLVGRSDEPVDAAEGAGAETLSVLEPERPRGGGIVPANGSADPSGEAIATRPERPALLDPANEYTVVVATYGGTMKDLAWATHDFLIDQGIAAYSPYQVGENIVVFAGAAPTKRELEDLEQRIRAISRDGRRGVYSDAYTVEIDLYVGR